VFVQALGLETARLICLCGAGGKTSLMLTLAREFVDAGERVLVTTTTKIASDEAEGPWPLLTAAGPGAITEQARHAAQGSRPGGAVIVVAGPVDGGKKLAGFPPEDLDQVRAQAGFDRIVVEADGSRRRPLKAPAPHEPVVPASTDAVVMVAGLSGIDKPLDEATVFRAELWSARTRLALGAPVSAASIACMVLHPEGLGRGCPEGARKALFLNQADTAPKVAAARRVIDLLADADRKPDRAVVGCLQPTPRIAETRLFYRPVIKNDRS
jgi:probable selenium-dependent hydroxylase accessory protein YqeC